MTSKYLYISKAGAESLLHKIKLQFPGFYFKLTGEIFIEDINNQHRYWAKQIGEFLRGLSKQDIPLKRNGDIDHKKRKERIYERVYIPENEIVLKDSSVLYEDLYLFIKNNHKEESKVSFNAIEGLFSNFFIEEIDKNPLTFGTWQSLLNNDTPETISDKGKRHKKINKYKVY